MGSPESTCESSPAARGFFVTLQRRIHVNPAQTPNLWTCSVPKMLIIVIIVSQSNNDNKSEKNDSSSLCKWYPNPISKLGVYYPGSILRQQVVLTAQPQGLLLPGWPNAQFVSRPAQQTCKMPRENKGRKFWLCCWIHHVLRWIWDLCAKTIWIHLKLKHQTHIWICLAASSKPVCHKTVLNSKEMHKMQCVYYEYIYIYIVIFIIIITIAIFIIIII